MRAIKKYVEALKEEVEGAKEYAECYIEAKASGQLQRASKCKEMAHDELKHAMYIHEWAVNKVNEISDVYTPPIEMEEAWKRAHKEYAEEVAMVKKMLEL